MKINVSIGTFRPFQHNKRTTLAVIDKEAAVHFDAFPLEYTHGYIAACLTQHRNAASVYLLKGIAAAHHNAWNMLVNNQLGAGRRLAIVGTRLQGNVDRTAAEHLWIFHPRDGIHLGMRLSATAMKTLTNNSSITNHHGTHHGVGGCVLPAATCQLKGAAHVSLICFS